MSERGPAEGQRVIMNEVLLALADDEHLMGHRHSEWVCVAPFLEEDLAFASIGQDELGHALALYDLLHADAEHAALRRSPEEWRSCWLVELPCRTWELALVRHWLYDTAERYRWEALLSSTQPGVAAVAARALREEDYHRRHALALIDRLLSATPESRARIVGAVNELAPYAVALWEPVAGDDTTPLAEQWRDEIDQTLRRHDVPMAWSTIEPVTQEGRMLRSPHFAEIHDALTEVLRLDPAATW